MTNGLIAPARLLLLAGLAVTAGSCHSRRVEDAGRADATASIEAADSRTLPERCGSGGEANIREDFAPLWIANGKLTPRGRDVLQALRTVGEDGLEPNNYLPAGSVTNEALSAALMRLAIDLRKPPPTKQITYVDEVLRPVRPCMKLILAAASNGSLEKVLAQLRAPNGAAAALRKSLQSARTPKERAELASDLALARSMGPLERALLIDTRSAQLWEVAGPQIAATMRVVVGKRGSDTPSMAALIKWAEVNPYWYVPPDLVRAKIAPHVLAEGAKYLRQHRYEIVDKYDDDDAHVLQPSSVNWTDVRSGGSSVGVRQLPGPDNMMGSVKFVFPNPGGIYLHDTPGRWAFAAADRHLSNGCIRVERAAELFEFLFGAPLPIDPADPEAEYDLDEPMPVFIAPLSAAGAAALSMISQDARRQHSANHVS